jgi:hypothetical protein
MRREAECDSTKAVAEALYSCYIYIMPSMVVSSCIQKASMAGLETCNLQNHCLVLSVLSVRVRVHLARRGAGDVEPLVHRGINGRRRLVLALGDVEIVGIGPVRAVGDGGVGPVKCQSESMSDFA